MESPTMTPADGGLFSGFCRARRTLAILVLSGGCASCAAPPASKEACPATPRQSLLWEINQARVDAGLRSVVVSPDLIAAAQGHAEELAAGQASGSRGSDGFGPDERVRRAGYASRLSGETTATGMNDPEQIVGQWLLSDNARGTLLDTRFRDVGIGLAWRNGHGYWVADFAVPASTGRSRSACHP